MNPSWALEPAAFRFDCSLPFSVISYKAKPALVRGESSCKVLN